MDHTSRTYSTNLYWRKNIDKFLSLLWAYTEWVYLDLFVAFIKQI